MVQILGGGQTFGEQIGAGIGRAGEMFAQMAGKKYEQKQRQQLLEQVEKGNSQPKQSEDITQKFLEALPEIENRLGRDLTPQDIDQLWERANQLRGDQQMMGQQQDPFMKAKKYAALGEHELARVATEEAKSGNKAREAEIARGYEESKPTRARGRELLEDLPYKENALTTMKEAIQSGNLGWFTLNNLAEMTGIEGLRSPEGAAFKTASKEFFLGNLSRVGSRGLNQMMERVVLEMSPLIGRKTEANLAVAEILGAENDVTRKEAELITDIGQKYKEKHGYYPDDLAARVYKELRPYAQQRQKDALAEVDRIKERYEPKNKEGVLMYDPSGNLRRVPHKNQKEAMKEGYRKA